jgi:hypothetical protein
MTAMGGTALVEHYSHKLSPRYLVVVTVRLTFVSSSPTRAPFDSIFDTAGKLRASSRTRTFNTQCLGDEMVGILKSNMEQ